MKWLTQPVGTKLHPFVGRILKGFLYILCIALTAAIVMEAHPDGVPVLRWVMWGSIAFVVGISVAPRLNWIAHPPKITLNQVTRRTLIVFLYGALAGNVIVWAMENPPFEAPIMRWITLLSVPLIIISAALLHSATSGNTLQKTGLDERQTELRNQAYFRGYILLGCFLQLLYLVFERIGLGYVSLSGLAFYLTIPTAILAWLEPDPIQDDIQTVEAVS